MASKRGFVLTGSRQRGREAVPEIVASGGGVGFVSSVELKASCLVPIQIDGPEMLMDEALRCLRERSGGKLVRAFFEIVRSVSAVS